MHRVGSAGNTSNSVRPRKEKRLTYVLNDADDTKVNLFCSHLSYLSYCYKHFLAMLMTYFSDSLLTCIIAGDWWWLLLLLFNQ